jgi:hypothetical protein
MALGFFTGDNAPDSYEARERKRRLAEALIQQGADYSPVQSWTQGAARLANALAGTIQQNRIGSQEKAANADYNKTLASILGGGGSPSPAMPSAPSAPGPAPGSMAAAGGGAAPDMARFAEAIKAKESGGKYDIVGPTHSKLGRALGAYQVMEANVGPWSREALGREVTPDEFLKNPQIQDQIFQHKFGQYVQKFGNPQDAASAWFTGQPLSVGANRRDVLGTTGAGYVADFNRNIGQQPTQVAQAGMTPDGMPTSPVASDAPPMAYAAGQQAIAQAATQSAPRGQQLAQAVGAPAMPQPQPTGNIQAAMMQILSDPRFSPQQKAQAMQMYQMGQRDEGVRPVDLGDKIALMDARGNIRQVLPKSQAPRGPMAVGPDQRLIDPNTGREIAGASQGKAPNVQKVKLPDGSEVAVQWDGERREWVPLNAPQGGNPVAPKLPKLTEQQSKDVGFVQRGKAANELLTPDAEKALLSAPDTALQNLPEVLGMNIGRRFQDEKFQTAFNAGRNFLAVVLRKDTGAAITREEWKEYTPLFIPQPGDTPDLLAQKRQNRTIAMQAMEDGLGNVGDVLNAVIGARKQATPSSAPGAPSRPDPSGALAAARDAIARGAPRDAVIKRLQENGIDPAGL